jgi:hypothetical protein
VVLNAFAQALIDYMKGPPSGTSRQQPLDASTNFRDVKKGLSYLTENKMIRKNICLEKSLEKALKTAKEKFPAAKITSVLKKKLLAGCTALVQTVQGKYCTPAKSRAGFVNCGHHIPDADPAKGECTVDYEKIMSCCLTPIDPTLSQVFLANKDSVVRKFQETGSCSTEFLDNLGIPRDENTIVRDDLCIWRQDTLMVTHADTVANYREFEQLQAIKNDPQLAKTRDATNKLPSYVKRKQKEEAAGQKKIEKEAAKTQEAQRVQALTAAEKKALTVIKKDEAIRKKEEAKKKKEDKERSKREEDLLLEGLVGPEKLDRMIKLNEARSLT